MRIVNARRIAMVAMGAILGMLLCCPSYCAGKAPRGTGTVAKWVWKKLTCEKCMGWGKVKEYLGKENTCPACGGGGERRVQVALYVCEGCMGSGGGGVCGLCNGTKGAMVPMQNAFGVIVPMWQACPACKGRGIFICTRCGGQGFHE